VFRAKHGRTDRLLGWLGVPNGRSLADACRNVFKRRNNFLLTCFSENTGGGVSKLAFLHSSSFSFYFFPFCIFGAKMTKRRQKGAQKGTQKGEL
jgi:hypothetical protein